MPSHRVELVNRGVVLSVPENQTILDAAEQAGLPLPVGCRYGACITCAAKLIDGKIDQPQALCLKPDQLEAGFVLLCVAYARSHCQLEVGVESQQPLYRNPFQG